MNTSEILTDITEILREIFDQPDLLITPASSAQTVPGWDSMKQVMILMAVEEKFNVKLNTREMARLKDVDDLIKIIDHKVNT